MSLYDELKWRGLIQDISSPELKDKLNAGGLTFYIGTDPTADSLHIGHFCSFLITKRLADYGHHPIILVGGATALIGDPRGTAERELANKEVIDKNFLALKSQIQKLFPYPVVNNYDWVKNIKVIDFLRDYGKYINVNYMLNKDLVRRQMDSGISYAEFSYMLIQGLDFKHLHENNGVNLQVAGSDQWGNITTGIELIRKTTGDEVYAFTMPLITKKDGTKFGKSEKGAIWLDETKTSPYELYQFFINSEDDMVEIYLKRFTFLTKEEIADIIAENSIHPENRIAAKKLAYEVTAFIHGVEEANKALEVSEKLFNKDVYPSDMPTYMINEANVNILDLLVMTNMVSSKSEARRLIEQGGVSINHNKITDVNVVVKIEEETVIQKGKKQFLRIKLGD